MSEFGETVYVASASNGILTGLIIGAQFDASENNVSIGRYRTSTGVDFTRLRQPTFGVSNPSSVTEFRTGTGAANSAPKVGPIVINEIMYNPKLGGTEFIEILNIASEPVYISGWVVAGAAFTFPAGTSLPPKGLLLLADTNFITLQQFRTNHNIPSQVPVFGHLFVLENEGEALRLEKPNVSPLDPFILMERVRYNDKSPWPTEADGEGPSLERFAIAEYGNDPVNWRTVQDLGSPGRANSFPLGLPIARGSSWKYNTEGTDLGTAWRESEYSDSSWLRGDGALGYGVADLLTPLYLPGTVKPITTWFRKEFVVNDSPAAIQNLQLQARFDDGFVLYLNGEEILCSGSMPGGSVRFDMTASSYTSLGYETFDLSPFGSRLRPGGNVIAVELHQENAASPDAVWDASLTYQLSSAPTLPAPVITPAGGSFSGPVTVTITNQIADALIYYTLNGILPDSSSTRYTEPLSLSGNVQVKALAYKAGFNESLVASAEFVFIDLNPDSDNDGLPDGWESQHFGNSTAADPNTDPDRDGLSNLQEYLAGTDPITASTLMVTISQTGVQQLSIRWTSTTNSTYQLERCANISSGSGWTVIASGIAATPPMNSYSISSQQETSFYRVHAQR